MTLICALCTNRVPEEQQQTLLWSEQRIPGATGVLAQLICAGCAERSEFKDVTDDVIGIMQSRKHRGRKAVSQGGPQ